MPAYNETRVRLDYIENGKNKQTVLEEERAQEWAKDFDASQTKYEVVSSQTFGFEEVSAANAIGDFTSLVTDPEEQANIINTGLVLKQQRYVRLAMLDSGPFTPTKFTPVEGVFSLRDVCAAKSEGRVAKSPEEKAASALGKILGRAVSADDLASIIAQLQAGHEATAA